MTDFKTLYPLNVTKKYIKKGIEKSFLFAVLSILPAFIGGIIIIVGYPVVDDSVLLSAFAYLGVFLIVFGILEFFYLLYIRFYIKHYEYSIDDTLISIKKGVFTPGEIHIQLSKIQDVFVDQDLIDRILGVYDIHFLSATAVSGVEAHIDGLDKDVATKLRELVLQKIKGVGILSEDKSRPHGIFKDTTGIEAITKAEFFNRDRYVLSELVGNFFSTLVITAILMFFAIIRTDVPSDYLNFTWYIYACAIIYICRIVYLFVWLRNYEFRFEDGFVCLKTGVFALGEIRIPYSSIQNTIVEQGVIERLFGLGTVKVLNAVQEDRSQTGGSPSEITLEGLNIDGARVVSEKIREVVSQLKNSEDSHGV